MSTTAPSLDAPAVPGTADRLRQAFVTVSFAFCVVGTLFGIGVIGTRVEESSGGSLAADATLLAPGGPAFSIWSVIYLGLAAYTVWQWLPRQAAQPRQRAIGYLAGVSMILNAAWLLVTQTGADWALWASVVVIASLAVVLGLLVRGLTALRPGGWGDVAFVDVPFGLYLGWVTAATCANVTAAFVASGVTFGPAVDAVLAVVVLAVAAGLGLLLARTLGARWAVAAALTWGLTWIGIARLTDEPRSTLVGVAALAAAVVVVVGTALLARARSPRAVAVGGHA